MSALVAGVPTHSTPSKESTTSSGVIPTKTFCEPTAPRLSPFRYSAGRSPDGSSATASVKASTSARASLSAPRGSRMDVNQDGTRENWVATVATSPLATYSRVRAEVGCTEPNPLVTTTTRCDRSNPPARRTSSTSSAARSSGVPAWLSPTYARIGSRAGVLEKPSMVSASGPSPTNARPCRPSVSHSTSDSGLPERRGLCGAGWPEVSASCATYAR